MSVDVRPVLGLLRGMAEQPDRHALDDTGIADVIRNLETGMRLMMAVQVQFIAEADRRGLAVRDGARSTRAWLQQMLRITGGDAKTRTQVGQRVEDHTALHGFALPPDLPATAAAMRAGAIGLGHGQAIAEGIADLPSHTTPQQRADAEALLADNARMFEPPDIRQLAERIRHRIDPDGVLDDEQQQRERRELHLGTGRDGMTLLKGRLDREAAEQFRAVLEPLAKPRPADSGEQDARTAGQRNADALMDLVDITSTCDRVPTSGGERPHLSIIIDFQDLVDRVSGGTMWRTGQPLSADCVRKLACDAKVIPFVLGGQSQPLDVGRAAYVVPTHLRKALEVRDGACAFPACDRPPGTSHCHHMRHWADGGETTLDNLVMLCGFHHRLVHNQHWRVRINDHGRPEFIPPRWVDPQQTPRAGIQPPWHTFDFTR